MARRARFTAHIGVLATVLLFLAAAPAGASYGIDFDSISPVSTRGDLVEVMLERVGSEESLHLTNTPTTGSADTQQPCQRRATIMPALDELWLVELGQLPDTDLAVIPIRIMCGGAIVDQYWATIAETRDYDTIARTEAQRHIEHHLAPTMAIAHSPPTNALVGLPTWAWLTGWDATPITIGPIAPHDHTLTIELTLHHTTWDFGDPHTPNPVTVASLGTPHTPDIAHTYTHHGPHTITATTTINVTYTLNTTGPHTVDPLTTTHTTPITLHQLQAILTHR